MMFGWIGGLELIGLVLVVFVVGMVRAAVVHDEAPNPNRWRVFGPDASIAVFALVLLVLWAVVGRARWFPPDLVLYVFAVAVVSGGAALVTGLTALGTVLDRWRAEWVDAGEATTGRVELSGTATVAADAVSSSADGEDCLVAFWQLLDDEPVKDYAWRRVEWGIESVPFLVEDDTGAVLVDPTGADVRFEQSFEVTVREDEQPPEGLSDHFEAPFPAGVPRRRYTEHRLVPGEQVTVFGTARPLVDADLDDAFDAPDASPDDAPDGVDTVVGEGEGRFVIAKGGHGKTWALLLVRAFVGTPVGAVTLWYVFRLLAVTSGAI